MPSRPALDRSSRVLEFLRTEEASGVFLLSAAVVALVWANSPLRESYQQLWSTIATIQIGGIHIALDLQHWVNEGLMTLFFLVVGLEIKREVATGELRDPKKLALPAIAAVGGMIVPAGIYLFLNAGSATANGWGVPVATDIAFALGVLTLAASRAPDSLRSFLLTLAIVDDIGAIILIAIFYSGGLATGWLAVAVATIGAIVALGRGLRVRSLVPYVLLGTLLWLSLYESGVHPTLSGVVLGLLAPAIPLGPSPIAAAIARQRRRIEDWVPQVDAVSYLGPIDDVETSGLSPLDRVETSLHPWTSRFVVPTFALANAGVELSEASIAEAVTSPVGLGVFIGLVVGKPLGIGSAAWLANRTTIARLPDEVTPRMVLGVAALAGVGFTVALFIAGLAFDDPRDVETAKLAVLAASVAASVFGAVILRTATRTRFAISTRERP